MTPGRFFGGLLMWVSGLWLLLSGACTLYFLAMGLDPRNGPDTQGLAGFVTIAALICGAIGILPGLIVFFIGRAISRSRRADAPPTNLPDGASPPA